MTKGEKNATRKEFRLSLLFANVRLVCHLYSCFSNSPFALSGLRQRLSSLPYCRGRACFLSSGGGGGGNSESDEEVVLSIFAVVFVVCGMVVLCGSSGQDKLGRARVLLYGLNAPPVACRAGKVPDLRTVLIFEHSSLDLI